MSFVVKPVAASVTYPLRQQILRPHQTLDQVGVEGDDEPDAGHFAAFEGRGEGRGQDGQDGQVVGVVSVLRQCPAGGEGGDAPDRDGWWRLRGMATAPASRHQGIGRALVAAVVSHAAGHGGTRLWCHARLQAVPFYRAVGFRTIGEQWEEPVIGPHIAMWRPLP